MKVLFARTFALLQEALQEYSTHDGPWLAGALAYYAAFAVFPLLMVLIAVWGFLLRSSPGAQDAQHQFLLMVARTTSPALASQVAAVLEGVKLQASMGGPLGLLTLLLGATGLFAALSGAFDRLWDVPTPPGIGPAVRLLLFQRLNGFLMLLGLGALVIATFVASLAMSGIDRVAAGVPVARLSWQIAQVGISVAVNSAVVAALYKVLPRPDLRWRDVWAAALFVALVWEIGKLILAWIVIGQNYTAYGVVGAFIALMAWIYYASILFFIGAAVVRVSTRARTPVPQSATGPLNAGVADGKQTMKKVFELFKQTFKEWSEDKAARLAAALAYYTIFAIAPLLVIIIAVVGLIFGRAAVQGEIVNRISGTVGPQSAALIQNMIASASRPSAGIIATVIGVVMLLLGATGVFAQLQDALNTIWEVAPRPGRSIWAMLRDRGWTFAMVLGIGLIFMLSLVISAALSALSGALGGVTSGVPAIWQVVNQVVSFGLITLLFALIFKYLPDVRIQWRDVWAGAAFTALLFTIGKYLLGLYLGRSSVSSAYGAAGSLVVILLWIYYSAQILFLGAEFTQVYARRTGKRIVPARDAIRLTDEARAEQGMPRREQLAQPSGVSQAAAGASPAPQLAAPAPAYRPARRQASPLAASSIGGGRGRGRSAGPLAAVAAGALFVVLAATRLIKR
jgi:membrane protein